MAYIVYMLIFPENNIYIGLTSNKERRIREHKNTFLENFEFETLQDVLTIEDACYLETKLISSYRKEYGSKLLNKADKGIAPTGISGEAHHGSKLIDNDIDNLRNKWITSGGSLKLQELATEYKVSITTIHNVLQNKRSFNPKYVPIPSIINTKSKYSKEEIASIRLTISTMKPRPTFKFLGGLYGFSGQYMAKLLKGEYMSQAGGPLLGKDY